MNELACPVMGTFFLVIKDKSNFVYLPVHRNILMFYIYLHTIYLCRYASTILYFQCV